MLTKVLTAETVKIFSSMDVGGCKEALMAFSAYPKPYTLTDANDSPRASEICLVKLSFGDFNRVLQLFSGTWFFQMRTPT
eukprot:624809-Karenia_brevis.AAC.1